MPPAGEDQLCDNWPARARNLANTHGHRSAAELHRRAGRANNHVASGRRGRSWVSHCRIWALKESRRRLAGGRARVRLCRLPGHAPDASTRPTHEGRQQAAGLRIRRADLRRRQAIRQPGCWANKPHRCEAGLGDLVGMLRADEIDYRSLNVPRRSDRVECKQQPLPSRYGVLPTLAVDSAQNCRCPKAATLRSAIPVRANSLHAACSALTTLDAKSPPGAIDRYRINR